MIGGIFSSRGRLEVHGLRGRVGARAHWPRLGAMCFAHVEWRREKVFRKRDEKALFFLVPTCAEFRLFRGASGARGDHPLGHRETTRGPPNTPEKITMGKTRMKKLFAGEKVITQRLHHPPII